MRSVAAVSGIEKLDANALRALGRLADSLGWSDDHLDHLASTIAIESQFDAKAVNPSSGASGLIQFMPSTATKLGTTIEAVRAMDAAGQLELAAKYFEPMKGIQPKDVPLAVFLPNFIGRGSDEVIATAGEATYEQNAGLDVGADGTITVGEVRGVYEGPLFAAKDRPRVEVPAAPAIWPWLLGGAVILAGGYLAWLQATGQSWDQPIRNLLSNPRDVEIRNNPSRKLWRQVKHGVCGRELKKRRALGREWAEKPCKQARSQLREQAELEREERQDRAAKATPAQRKAQRRRREGQQEAVEREANDLATYLETHSDLSSPAIGQAVRDFKKDPWPYFRRSKASGGRTSPYEFAARDAEENEGELIEAAQAHADRELRKSERRREQEEEIPF